MIEPGSIAVAIATVVAACLGVALFSARRRARRSERLLQVRTAALEQLQVQFTRFAHEEVVERLTGDAALYTPERRHVAVLFADLRGFTAMCEALDPMTTVVILNGYFQQMSEAIARHHGAITELIGDGLLALFGALEPNPWQARDAVMAGLDMRAELARYNARLCAQALPELRFGVGIHCGDAVAGVIGTAELKKFSIVGDTINLASRVEGLTREHQVDLLITEAIRSKLDGRFRLRTMPPKAVKGKSEPLVTYHVEGLEGGAA